MDNYLSAVGSQRVKAALFRSGHERKSRPVLEYAKSDISDFLYSPEQQQAIDEKMKTLKKEGGSHYLTIGMCQHPRRLWKSVSDSTSLDS